MAIPDYARSAPTRTVESEGILRMLLLVLALAMPLATLAYLKIQSTRLSYAMGDLKERIRQEEEVQRKLLLERSRFQRGEEVQVYAEKTGLQPRKQGHLIRRAFTPDDQRLAKLRPVSSEGL
jgi:hypothetical protein